MRADEGVISRRYARAAMAWCDQHGGHEEFLKGLTRMAEAMESIPVLDKLLTTPLLKKDQKLRLVREVGARVVPGEGVMRFLEILVQRGRLEYLRAILARFEERLDEKLGRVRARVTTAVELEAGLRKEVEDALARLLRKKVVCSFYIDESLYAGVVARVGGLLIDSSIRGQLDRLKERIDKLSL